MKLFNREPTTLPATMKRYQYPHYSPSWRVQIEGGELRCYGGSHYSVTWDRKGEAPLYVSFSPGATHNRGKFYLSSGTAVGGGQNVWSSDRLDPKLEQLLMKLWREGHRITWDAELNERAEIRAKNEARDRKRQDDLDAITRSI